MSLVKFEDGLPSLLNDLVHYLTGFNFKSHLEKEKKRLISSHQTSQEVQLQRIMAVSLKQLRLKFHPDEAARIESSFLKLCDKKGDPANKAALYINEESFMRSFSSVFFYDNPPLAKRILSSFTNYQPSARIYMEQYFERIYPLIYGGSDYKNRLAY